MRRLACLLSLIGLACAGLSRLPAAINPSFTPVQLVQQSEQVLLLKLSAPNDKNRLNAQVVRSLKGKADEKTVVIDLSASPLKEVAKEVGRMAATLGDHPALLFAGEFKEENQENNQKKPEAFLHLGGKWVGLYRDPKAPKGQVVYQMDAIDNHMEATWAGGSDMLLRCVQYVVGDPDARIPVVEGAAWKKPVRIGKSAGPVHGMEGVDLKDDGQLHLYVAAESGDQLYQFDRKSKAIKEVGGGLKLAARSTQSVWGDFNGDGRLDLASFDGKALVLWLQGENGSFTSQAVKESPAECLGLAALDVGGKSGAGLLVSTKGVPLLLKPRGGGAFASAPLSAGFKSDAKLGAPGRCLVADLDGDGLCDVLQPFAQGSLFYKGTAVGQFAAPVACAVALGAGRAGAFLGDFDGDGLLDVYAVAEDRLRLWQNQGAGKFIETHSLTGEANYIAQPGAFSGVVGDINNDGRQDVLLLYTKLRPLIFFNRGFRSFGHAHGLDLEEQKLLEPASKGQQAGLLADLDQDGTQDLALALSNGEVWFFPNELAEGDPLGVRVALPASSPGPIAVTAYQGDRLLGAWNVTAGGPGAYFGRQEAGSCKVKWRFPGGTVQEKEIIVERKPVRLVVKP